MNLPDWWRSKSRRARWAIVGPGLALVTAAGVLVVNEDPPGNPAVYERISSTTDCAVLQAEFDLAMDNHDRARSGEARRWTLAYAEAADRRMSKLGCYG